MPSPKSAADLARLLHAADSPIYFVADDRRLVFVNRACAKWLGVNASDVQGKICRYQSADSDLLNALADALCPPPEVFHGERTSAIINLTPPATTPSRRQAEFIPLSEGDGAAAGVVVLVGDAELPESALEALPAPHCNNEAAELHELVQKFRAVLANRHRPERLAGRNPAIVRVRSQVELAAKCRQTVLIVGPRGSGKQHVAGAIHFVQSAPFGALVPISCAALPGELLISTLSALANKQAAGSDPMATLLLTDVQMLPVEVQSDVAKWLAAGPKNIRVIATSVLPLASLLADGRFSRDLAMLLSTIVIELPSLSSRSDDIPLIAQMLVEDCNANSKSKQIKGLTPDAMDRLVAYAWPGEIDELASIIAESFAAAEGFEIKTTDLPKKLHFAAEAAKYPRKAAEPINLEQRLAEIETALIESALKQSKHNKTQAAKLLGLTRPRLYRRMVQLGMIAADDGQQFEQVFTESPDGNSAETSS